MIIDARRLRRGEANHARASMGKRRECKSPRAILERDAAKD